MVRIVKVMIFKAIYTIGQKFRNPSIKKQLLFLKESEKWTLEKLEEYQLKKLKELIDYSIANSEYYQNRFSELNISSKDINSLNDLEKIPIITKDELITYNDAIHTKIKFTKIFKAMTSGTTGKSLIFLREELADSFNRASIFRGYSWYDVNPWDRNGYFWGFNYSYFKKRITKTLDYIQNRFRIFNYTNKDFNVFVKKLNSTTYIHGYSSIIYQSARLINQNKLPKPQRIKMVKGTSEKIFDFYQQEVIDAFGVKIISEYGAAESGIIAFECPFGNMHINMEGVIVEEVDKEIIVTNLQMKSFPIIRYKLGDYIQLSPKDKKCKCGKNHLIIEEVTGRIGENVYGISQIYPSLYFYYIFKNLAKSNKLEFNYQVIQKEKGKLIFNIEQKTNEKEHLLLEKQICKYFKDDIVFKIYDNKSFKYGKGKLKSFISEINE